MELQQLRYFVAATYEKSFAGAAKGCFTTRQNVSRAISSLEEELGVKLFKRRGNTMLPTPAGEIAVKRAQQVIDIVDGLKRDLGQPVPPTHRLKLAISSNLFAGVSDRITSAVDQYSQQGYFSEKSCEECYFDVVEGSIDAALISCMKRDFPDCEAIRLGSSASYLLVSSSSRLAARNCYSVSDLRNVRFSLMSTPPFQYVPLIELLKSMNYSPENISVITSTSSMIHYIKRGDIASIVSDRMAAASPEGTVAIPIIDSRVKWHLYILYREDTQAHAVISELARSIRSEISAADSF